MTTFTRNLYPSLWRIIAGVCLSGLLLSTPILAQEGTPFVKNAVLGRGMNMGNSLEAPIGRLYLKEEHFKVLKESGFQSVRIPIRWASQAQAESPYTISASLFKRVDTVVDQALAHDLAVVINIHHYAALMSTPEFQKERFLALWDQIAAHYQDQPDTLYFELLNEPTDNLTPEIWNPMIPDVIQVIRKTNPTRMLIVGSTNWSNVQTIPLLELPADDPNLIATFHYYHPFEFTHQGASWVPNSSQWVGTRWTGTPEQQEAVRAEFDMAAQWAKAHNRMLYLGEFGAYYKIAAEDRAAWAAFITREAEKRDIAWAWWDFATDFAAYNLPRKEWKPEMIKALIP